MKRHLVFLLVFFACLCSEAMAWTVTGTGLTDCQDANGWPVSCPHSGQDCYGQDANFRRPMQTFNLGNQSLAVDTHTGLTWQRNDDAVQRNWAEAVSYCAELVLEEYDDWRLPSMKELQTIYYLKNNEYYACIDNTCISKMAFPNTRRDGPYWSDTTSHAENSNAWYLSFNGLATGAMNKDGEAYTRCVRGTVLPHGPFVAADAVVNDQATGLMWEKNVSDADMSWPSALAYCYGRTTGGYTDWRLPDIRELDSIVDFSTDTPALDAAFTTANPSLWLWSSTPSKIDGGDTRAFGISQEFGYTDTLGGAAIHALCVRGGQVTPITPSVPFSLFLLGDN
ncbi:MAG: DUF1566 domain-containing protein [Solidesulfovibrio sp. DCME]|uniref:Lcl C-terminal domain-containing protein n=1 Tax=Solidesulfovibrio sp. DCME TaxID=3447380 RepID=UPI003D149650